MDIQNCLPIFDPRELARTRWLDAYSAKHGISVAEVEKLIQQKEAEYRDKEIEAARRQDEELTQSQESARQEARTHARMLLSELVEEVRAWYINAYPSTSAATDNLENEILGSLDFSSSRKKPTIDDAVKKVKATIARDFRRDHPDRAKSLGIVDDLTSRREFVQKPPAYMGLHHPLIKWRDNKWRQADKIVAHFPHRIETYYEPFLGSASVLYKLLGSNISVRRFECSDTSKPLIAFWQVVKDNPSRLVEEYTKNWRMLRRDDEACFEAMKQKFAVSNDPILFFSLLSFTQFTYSMFSESGSFTGRYHREGRTPGEVARLTEEWGRRLRRQVRLVLRARLPPDLAQEG